MVIYIVRLVIQTISLFSIFFSFQATNSTYYYMYTISTPSLIVIIVTVFLHLCSKIINEMNVFTLSQSISLV